jgi:hypothetical protein
VFGTFSAKFNPKKFFFSRIIPFMGNTIAQNSPKNHFLEFVHTPPSVTRGSPDSRPWPHTGMQETCQKPSLIIEPAKTAGMISISSKGLCEEDDFRYLWEEEARIPGMNERNYSG